MRKLLSIISLLLCTQVIADVKLGSLPLGTASSTGVNDSFPFVDATANVTKRLKLIDLINLPTFPLTTKGDLLTRNSSAYARFPACANGESIQWDSTQILGIKCVSVTGTGTVTSVALSLPSELTVSGSPVTTSGTLGATWTSQSAHKFLASPSGSSGAMSARTIVGSDLPVIDLTTGVTSVLPVANGGTNSSATLNNNRIMQSSGSTIVESTAITPNRALISDSNGIPTHSSVTSTELGYVSGVTSALQTQLDAKASTTLTSTHLLVGNGSNVATDVVASGDLTLANTGAFTVATVGTSSASNIHAAELLANAATNSNTASTIVKRDSSGNFTAGTITAALTGNASTATVGTTATTTTKSDNVSYFPTFVSANSSSNQAIDVGPMTYNPSTSTLTATTFSGALSGNATTATTATNATNTATTAVSTNATYYPTFVASSSNSNQAQSLDTGLTYNPSTHALTTTTFVGALTGNASGTAATFTGNLTGAVTSTAMATTFVDAITGDIETPSDKTYVLDQSAAFAYTINTLKIITSAGTVTVAIKINGTSVTGISAVSCSSTVATGTATAANTVAIGDRVTLVTSSTSSAADLAFTLKYTR